MIHKQPASLDIEVEQLREENARLVRLLRKHGIDPNIIEKSIDLEPTTSIPKETQQTKAAQAHQTNTLSPHQKISLFRSLFRGRTDVYPIRWENQSGKAGYSPACANEWRVNVRARRF